MARTKKQNTNKSEEQVMTMYDDTKYAKEHKEEIKEFFKSYRPEGYLYLSSLGLGHDNKPVPKAAIKVRMPDGIEQALDFVVKQNRCGCNVYFAVNPVNKETRTWAGRVPKISPRVTDVEHVDTLFLDLDPQIPKSNSFEEARENILQQSKTLSHNATWLIDSGNGLQVFRRLNAPISIERGKRANIGLLIDNPGADAIQNVNRVMRVPFTVNYATKKKLECGYPPISYASLIKYNPKVKLNEHIVEELVKKSPEKSTESKHSQELADAVNEYRLEGLNPIDLGGLQLSPELKDKIRNPCDKYTNGAGRHDRSAQMLAVANALYWHGLSHKMVLNIMLDPSNCVSEKALEKPDPAEWLGATLEKAYTTVNEAQIEQCIEDFADWEDIEEEKYKNKKPLHSIIEECVVTDGVERDIPFLVENMFQEGVSVFAAFAGAGKTTVMCRLATIVTKSSIDPHKYEQPFRRHVFYLSESAEQVKRILWAMVDSGMIDNSWKDYIHIYNIRQPVPAEQFLPVLKDSITNDKYNVEYVNTWDEVYIVKPWVIIDTMASMFLFQNEKEQLDAKNLMNVLRNEFHGNGYSCTVVMHTAKATRYAEGVDLTPKGSTEFMSLAEQVFIMSQDKDGNRWLEVTSGKVRFPVDDDILKITANTHRRDGCTSYGEEKIIKTMFVELTPYSREQRKIDSAKEREEKKEQRLNELEIQVLNYIIHQTKEQGFTTRGQVRKNINGNNDTIENAITGLVNSGDVIQVTENIKTHPHVIEYIQNGGFFSNKTGSILISNVDDENW